jgi:DNA-binding NtrC family response regulator
MSENAFHISGPGSVIVLVSPEPSEHDSLNGILQRGKCRLHCLQSCREAVSFLSDHPAGVVITNANLPDGTWKDLLNQTMQLPNAPNLIIASRLADEHLWAEVLNMGGYDLLLMPYDADEAIRIITQAWQNWERRGTATAPTALPARDTMVGLSEKRILTRGPRAAAPGRPSASGAPPKEDVLRTPD